MKLNSRAYDYAVHSDFLIHWTGRDIDADADAKAAFAANEDDRKHWYEKASSRTDDEITERYVERFRHILKFGLWMTEDPFYDDWAAAGLVDIELS